MRCRRRRLVQRVLAALQPRLPQVYEVSVQFIKPVLLPSTVRLALGEQ